MSVVKPLLKINTECVENRAIEFIEDYIAIPECTKLNKYNIQSIKSKYMNIPQTLQYDKVYNR